MPKVTIGNHSAVRVSRAERDRIRNFYCDVLGCTLTRTLDDKDDIRMGDGFYIGFLYGGGGQEVEKGVSYAADEALDHAGFLKALFLELKTDDIAGMRKKIADFGVTVLDVPDPHLYFQAPGGQVFRLVGMDEDLTRYERNV